jgi:poly-gamma-glutamate synthesis protein (capsule biosynthesis protein)
VGDIMLDRGVRYKVNKYGGGEYRWLFNNIPELGHSDITFGNLEGPLSDQGHNVGSIYSFRMAPEAAPVLAQAGFDVLSVANNHSGDYTLDALLDTVARLTAAGIMPVGGGSTLAQVTTPQIMLVGNKKIGFLAASDVGPSWLEAGEEMGGILLATNPHLADIISQAAAQVDYLIVSFHFGEEYRVEPTERQRYLAHLAIAAGAKVVAGAHPHVVGPVEEYQGGLIAYSLGNFIFDQAFSPATMQGGVLQVSISPAGELTWQLQTTQLDEYYRPHINS